LLSNETTLDLDLFRTINRSVSLIKKERPRSIVRCVKKADVAVYTFFKHKGTENIGSNIVHKTEPVPSQKFHLFIKQLKFNLNYI